MEYFYITIDGWVRDVTETIPGFFFSSVVYSVVFFVLNWIQKYCFLFLERRDMC